MKSLKITLSFLFVALFSIVSFAAESSVSVKKESSAVISESVVTNDVVQDRKLTKKVTLKEKFIAKRLSKIAKRIKNNKNSKYDTILLVIVAILIPPVAVLMLENGLTTNFWIDLLLTLLFYLPGLIFALYLILQ